MANDNKCSNLKALDPVQGLVDYVNDVKPYHTKIIEVLVEYQYDEPAATTMNEALNIVATGGIDPDETTFLLDRSDSETDHFIVTGHVASYFPNGQAFLVRGTNDNDASYTSIGPATQNINSYTTSIPVASIPESVPNGWIVIL